MHSIAYVIGCVFGFYQMYIAQFMPQASFDYLKQPTQTTRGGLDKLV